MSDIVERLRDQYHETGGLAILLAAVDEIESLRARLAEVDKILRPLVDDDNRPVEALARHAVARLAEAEALLRTARDMIDGNMNHYIGHPPYVLVRRIDAFLARENERE